MLTRVVPLIFLLLFNLASFAEVRLPKLISDGMVLQRDARTRIWGWAAPGEKISVTFLNKTHYATTATDGKWQILLTSLKAGGPYEMQISGSNMIKLKDILIGDVWICSGQSNMEMAMSGVQSKYPDDIASSENKFIRQFAVPKKHLFSRQMDDLSSGSWISADPNSVLKFTAAGYYFARDLYAKYKVPIGLINSTLGGSRTESWMSEQALKPFPELHAEALHFKDTNNIIQTEASDRQRISEWNKRARENDAAYADPIGPWNKTDHNTSTWDEIKMPARWETTKLGNITGVVWLKRDFTMPPSSEGKTAKLVLGNIVEADSTFINGKYVGGMGSQYIPRNYTVPAGLLKAGKNSITVRVVCPSGRGGFIGDKQYALISGDQTIDLSGTWKYKLGVKMENLIGSSFIQWKSTGLYNAMLAPLLPYTIKGALWYQGESNIGRHIQQRSLFTALINSWRESWQQGNFPFLFVQLPNFNAPVNEPSDGGWARFREAQTAALALPNTGMAVAIDIGEWNDIHPLNKKDLGYRLSLAAQRVAYHDKKIVYAGPVYQSMRAEGNKIILSFDNTGGGLISKGDSLHYFAIAGADKKFVWAKASIQNNKVVVWSESIVQPVAVRYAWADDPKGANLYNKEGLPAAPFRTDDY
ncbi:sialate O-acetylesterase [Terrimonas sp. NA20]|uniref:Sialate O-acetylesterase n=1 Tax=Terrimonas ginsenosidimutans TaxID=2908004 RepID=A0ABS9KV56_9BACT|nr:sialate O-acetylesterase [Terrimonas ginsenosidimutans]MCG2616205.1 sialate O-acetylesterase [Terrimonas ginsenosidimutans]